MLKRRWCGTAETLREKRFTLRRSQREELWRRFKQTDDLALTRSSTNATFAEDPLSEQRIGGLRRLVDADDRGLNTPLKSVERAALPLALARQPLWWVGRWRALLHDEEVARRGFAELAWDREWALQLIREADRWQAAFACGTVAYTFPAMLWLPQLAGRSRQHWSAPRHALLQPALRRPAEGRTPPVRGVRALGLRR